MADLTPLAVGALGLLRERPMHPYEMYQLLRERHEDRFLKVSVGSLYATVDRLADQGLVEAVSTEQVGNRPERTTYRIAEAGQAALHARIAELLVTPCVVTSPFHVAIAEAHNLPREQVCDLLDERLRHLDEDVREMDLLLSEAHDRGVAEAYFLAGSYALEMRRAEQTFIRELRARLNDKDFSWPIP